MGSRNYYSRIYKCTISLTSKATNNYNKVLQLLKWMSPIQCFSSKKVSCCYGSHSYVWVLFFFFFCFCYHRLNDSCIFSIGHSWWFHKIRNHADDKFYFTQASQSSRQSNKLETMNDTLFSTLNVTCHLEVVNIGFELILTVEPLLSYDTEPI